MQTAGLCVSVKPARAMELAAGAGRARKTTHREMSQNGMMVKPRQLTTPYAPTPMALVSLYSSGR